MAPSALTIRDDPHSASKLVPDLPTVVSVSPTTVFVQESVAPLSTTTTVVVTSVLAPPPPPATTAPTAVYTTITQVLTTVPVAALPTTTIHETPADTTSTTLTTYVHTTAAGFSKTTSSARSSSVRTGPSPAPSSNPTLLHKAKSNTGKYVGYAIGGFFLLLLVSSFFSAWRKHRKYVRKRPRGSIFIGSKLSDGQSTPPKRSMAQALMRSVSNSSFDAYALCSTPPATPLPVYGHPESLLVTRGRPAQIRPLPQTPQTKDESPSGVLSSGSSGG